MDRPIRIDGATRLFVIIGDPVVQVGSPTLYSNLFAARGVNAIMVPLHVSPADVEAVGRALGAIKNLDGIIVTVPHKPAFARMAASLGATAQSVGAVNALRRTASGDWHGDMFDGAGFVAGAQRAGIDLSGRTVLQYGAGGAGSAIAYGLVTAGVKAIRLVDPDAAKELRLTMAIQSTFVGFDISPARLGTRNVDMVVNASTVGQGGARGLPGDIPPLSKDIVVGEVNVTETGTDLIRMARAAGCRCVDGRDMMEGQVSRLLEFFFPLGFES